jgi:hypothetical protein
MKNGKLLAGLLLYAFGLGGLIMGLILLVSTGFLALSIIQNLLGFSWVNVIVVSNMGLGWSAVLCFIFGVLIVYISRSMMIDGNNLIRSK